MPDDVLARDSDVLFPAFASDDVYGVGSCPASGQQGGALLVAGFFGERALGDDHQQRLPADGNS